MLWQCSQLCLHKFIHMRTLFLLFFVFLVTTAHGQERFTVSGIVKSKAKGETIIGATIKEGTIGTVSNEYGFYSLTLSKGAHTLEVSSLGLQAKTVAVTLDKNTTLNIILEDESKDLKEVTIRGQSAGRSI